MTQNSGIASRKAGERIAIAFVILVIAAAAAFADTPGPRLRVAIPAILNGYRETTPADADDMFTRIMGLLLRERSLECDSFELISQKRCDAIMSELTSPARCDRSDDMFREFRQLQPVDAIVFYRLEKSTRLEIRVISDSGVVKTNFDIQPLMTDRRDSVTTAFAPASRIAMRFIADNLPIADRDRKVLTRVDVTDPERLTAIYTSQYYPQAEILFYRPVKPYAPYAGPRVNVLLGCWRMDADDPLLSAAVVKAVTEMYLAYAEPVNGEYKTSSTFLKDSAAQRWVVMAKFCYKEVLGTKDEPAVYPLVRLAPSVFEKETLELAKPVLSMDENWLADDKATGAQGILGDTMADTPAKPISRVRRLGAVRVLGMLNLPASTNLLAEALNDDTADVREAAAFGAGWLPSEAGMSLLKPLLKDKDRRVVFAAAIGLRRMGSSPTGLLEMAKPFLTETSNLSREAVAIMAELGGKVEIPLLQKMAEKRTPQRPTLITTLLRLGAVNGRRTLELLNDSDEAVIQAVLASSLELAQDAALRKRIETLANDPLMPIANRSRYLLARATPQDPWQAMALELKIEHPYIRDQILDKLAADPGAQAIQLLKEGCGNHDHHVRTKAMQILARRDPVAAATYVARGLADPYQWVRFHAAVLAPQVATPDMVPALKTALGEADHSATRLYLREALAKVDGSPPPKQPPAAFPINNKRNMAWCTAPGIYAADSPFDGYYCMDTRWMMQMRAAHGAGKLLYARCMPLRAPAKLVLDRVERDAFIPRLDQELPDEVMEMLDGIIYGEETMEYLTDALWDDGWQLFCRDAKIDPAKVDGKLENLNLFERRAWENWAGKINTKGFNILADFTRARYGKLRPGLQIGSFQFGGPEIHCDFSGVYDYKGDNRLCAYDLVRSSKTICPERPVLWLSLGLGGYEMNPVHNTDPVPTGTMFDTYNRSWSDSITAWLAGAENGWFSVWLFVNPLKGRTDSGPSSLRGKIVWVEDISPASPILSEAIDWTQVHESKYKEPVVIPTSVVTSVISDDKDELDDMILEDPDEKLAAGQKAVDKALAKRKEEMTVGFMYKQTYVYDCARVIASLPRLEHKSQALVNRGGVDVWTRPESGYPRIPAHALLNSYDYLYDLNQAPAIDISKYRLFITHDTRLLKDETIRVITKWLKEQPGLLIVHRNLPAENDAEASTVEDHDGKLVEDWPWENDVRIVTNSFHLTRDHHPLTMVFENRALALTNGCVRSHFELAGPKGISLATVNGRTVLALWQDPAVFKGMVLFDGMEYTSNEYLDALRATINALYREKQVGMRVEGPALLETLNTTNIAAAAATRYYNPSKETVIVPGLSALGIGGNPVAGRLIGSTSGLTIRNYVGRYIAASEVLSALSEKPFAEARIDGSNLVLKSSGVVRVNSASQGVTVATLDGKVLPVIKTVDHNKETADYGKDGFARWLFDSKDPGLYHVRIYGTILCYFRSTETVVVRPAPRLYPGATASNELKNIKALRAIRAELAEEEKARKIAPVEEISLSLGSGVKMAFVKVKAIGGWVGKFEVTNQEFRRFRPGHDSKDYDGISLNGERQPVVNVTHDDALAFADWLNRVTGTGMPSGLRARLPGEKEWLAYSTCGDDRTYPWGKHWPPEYGNYYDTSEYATNLVGGYRDGYIASCPVEDSGRNDWGLYGVGGNVCEWTGELAPGDCEWRIRRGASWNWDIWGQNGYEYDLRCAQRSYAFPSLRHHGTGFRLILTPVE